uniref:Uncharacterized protein n=1 Tax=Cacopsylla melanoneura TaxID=428564 RepID=A0A8D8SFF9_9HEMI
MNSIEKSVYFYSKQNATRYLLEEKLNKSNCLWAHTYYYGPTCFTKLFLAQPKGGHIYCFGQKRDILASPVDCSGQRDQGLQSGTFPPKAGRMVSLVMRYIASVRHAKRMRNCMHLTSCKLGIFLQKRMRHETQCKLN